MTCEKFHNQVFTTENWRLYHLFSVYSGRQGIFSNELFISNSDLPESLRIGDKSISCVDNEKGRGLYFAMKV